MKARLFSLLSFLVVLALLVPGGARPTAAQLHSDSPGAPPLTVTGLPGSAVNAVVPAATTADAENVEFVGHIGGATVAVAVQGDYAYISEGPALTILDISDPASPAAVGKTPLLPDVVQGVAVAGGYAYVADGYDGGLRVVDVSTPSNPTEVGFYDTPGYADGVAVAGDYAYVADGGGLRVVDVSDPANPTEVGFYDTPGWAWAWGVAVAGGYAYVADGDAGLIILRYTGGVPGSIVTEARVDIGMPYSIYRGCPSPYAGCGGPFHGFYYGVCTDLGMDAYNAAVPFNLQDALYQDHRAHPGRYRWGSARNAEDMRRYFSYNQQLLPHNQAYGSGDIVFFDWNGDGLSNHVGLISEVDADGRPLRMVHATGVCGVNPSGLAFEQAWNSHYDEYIQGHGRLNGPGSSAMAADETLQVLRITADSPFVALRLLDGNGKSTSSSYVESLVALNNEAAIPYIPGGTYDELDSKKVITVTQPLSSTSQYFVELTGQAAVTYSLRLETWQDSSMTDSEVFTQAITSGETQGSQITLSTPGGIISFTATSPAPSPTTAITDAVELSGLAGTSAQASFTVAEVGGQQSLQNVLVSVTDLMDQLGGVISGSQLIITPSSFSVAAGGSQEVNVQVDLVDVAPGVYRGGLVLTSDSGGARRVRLTLSGWACSYIRQRWRA